MRKTIGRWTLDDWNGQWDPHASEDSEDRTEIELLGDDELYIEHDVQSGYHGGRHHEHVRIPLDVMKEFIRLAEERIQKKKERKVT